MLCAYLAAGVLVGLALNAVLGLWWADPVVAACDRRADDQGGLLTWHGDDCCTSIVAGVGTGEGCHADCCD